MSCNAVIVPALHLPVVYIADIHSWVLPHSSPRTSHLWASFHSFIINCKQHLLHHRCRMDYVCNRLHQWIGYLTPPHRSRLHCPSVALRPSFVSARVEGYWCMHDSVPGGKYRLSDHMAGLRAQFTWLESGRRWRLNSNIKKAHDIHHSCESSLLNLLCTKPILLQYWLCV